METNKTTKTQVFNLIILDKSGSMDSIRKEAIAGYNETLGSIKAAQLKYYDTQEHYISLAAFCGCGVDMIYDCIPVKDAEKLTKAKYNPCCMTPLYDAIGKSIKTLEKKTADIEDGFVKGFISYAQLKEELRMLQEKEPNNPFQPLEKLEHKYQSGRKRQVQNPEEYAVKKWIIVQIRMVCLYDNPPDTE